MKSHVRALPAVVIAAGCLVLGSTVGAVAGAQITGAQIKNGTITSSDVKNGSLLTKDLASSTISALQGQTGQTGQTGPAGPAGPAGAPGALGREEINNSQALAANAPLANLTAACPPGKVAVGGSGFWTSSSVAVQFTINLSAVRAFTPGISTADTLNVRAICVNP